MRHLTTLITIDKTAATPVYLQISNSLMHHIRQGRLRTGLRLPGSREMAGLLNINRMTMVAVYDELEAQGWIEKIPRKGTFIKKNLPLLTPESIRTGNKRSPAPSVPSFRYEAKKVIPVESSDFPSYGKLYFNDGFPDPRITPVAELTRRMRSLSDRSTGKKYLMYGGAQGTQFLRNTLARYLNDTRGLSVTEDNILITRGAQMGMYLSASLLLDPGDAVIVGQPGYNGANLTFQQLGARIQSASVDENGLVVSEVEKLCKKKKIKMVYVIPHHHNPTTVTLAIDRRIQLLELAARYGFAIIEDDYDYDFHYASKPIMPMASIDTGGSVIYIGTMTKTLAPAIRFGFMVAPEAFIQTATYLRKSIDTQGDSLTENALASMFRDGTMTRHIKKSVRLYRERRDHFCRLLETELGNKISFRIPGGGMSVWVNFLDADVKKIAAQAYTYGLVMRDGTDYDTGSKRYNSVRIGFASLNFDEQQKAISILKKIMH